MKSENSVPDLPKGLNSLGLATTLAEGLMKTKFKSFVIEGGRGFPCMDGIDCRLRPVPLAAAFLDADNAPIGSGLASRQGTVRRPFPTTHCIFPQLPSQGGERHHVVFGVAQCFRYSRPSSF